MALDTYANLQTSIGTFLNRADLTSIAPDFIALAEAQITRRIVKDGPVRQMMGRSDATINSEFVSLPNDFLGARAMILDGADNPLEFVEPEEIVRRKALYPNETGDPQIYTVVGGEFQFWPWVSGSYDGELTYWKSIPALSVSNTTNWLLTAYPDIYLYTSLLNSAPYLRDDPRLTVWGSLAEAAIADLIRADKLARTSTHLAISPVLGGTP